MIVSLLTPERVPFEQLFSDCVCLAKAVAYAVPPAWVTPARVGLGICANAPIF